MERAELKFTPTQIALLEKLWDTKTEAKVGRRYQNEDGSYRFEHIIRPTRPVDFAQEGEFVLKLHEKKPNAPLSPYYINLRNLPDDLLTLVAESIAETTQDLEIDHCTGIPQAGTPIALKYSEITGIPYREIFEKAESGSGRKIVANDFHYQAGRKLLILDDLITEADTKFEAAEVAKQLGYQIAGFGVLVDRQQGGSEQLRATGVYASLLVSEVFGYYKTTQNPNRQSISEQNYTDSMNYLNEARSKAGLGEIALLTT